MLSADAQESLRKPDEQAAFNQYLVKPVNNSALLDAIKHWLALEWLYQETQESGSTALATEPIPIQSEGYHGSPARIPDHESVRELMAFAEMGYKKGVRGVLDLLAKKDVIAPSHLQQLESLYQGFQFDAIAQYIQTNSQLMCDVSEKPNDESQ